MRLVRLRPRREDVVELDLVPRLREVRLLLRRERVPAEGRGVRRRRLRAVPDGADDRFQVRVLRRAQMFGLEARDARLARAVEEGRRRGPDADLDLLLFFGSCLFGLLLFSGGGLASKSAIERRLLHRSQLLSAVLGTTRRPQQGTSQPTWRRVDDHSPRFWPCLCLLVSYRR